MKIRTFKSPMAFLCSLIIVVSAILSGCSSATMVSYDGEITLSDGEYYVYYRDGDSYTLTTAVYTFSSEKIYDLIDEMFETLKNPESSGLVSTIPEDLLLSGVYLDDHNVTLDFSASYTSMNATDEILCRTAIVKTVLQISWVESVTFNVSGQALSSNTGRTIGAMTDDSFESSLNQSLMETELTLYFTDETGTYLKSEKRDVVYRSGQSLESLVIEELIDGPQESGNYAVLDSSLKLTSVSVTDSVCYVYFDASFLENSLEVADYIPIYAIVNSLSELSTVSRVQFVIAGSQDVSFRSISLSSPLSTDLNYIAN